MRWIVLYNWLQTKFTSVSLFKNTKFNRIQSKGIKQLYKGLYVYKFISLKLQI